MNENLEYNDWINEAPTLAAIGKRNPFSVPDRYFDYCEEAVLSTIFLEDLKQKSNGVVFEVPQNYFEELTGNIETRIAFGQSIPMANKFAVPEHYFGTLQSRIANKIATEEVKKEAKIIPLWKRTFVKYASVACFLIIASFSLYLYQNGSSTPANPLRPNEFANEQLLYDIDETTIIDHLEAELTNKKSVSDTEVENYILSNYSTNDLTQEL